jgi:hypothetical protein
MEHVKPLIVPLSAPTLYQNLFLIVGVDPGILTKVLSLQQVSVEDLLLNVLLGSEQIPSALFD